MIFCSIKPAEIIKEKNPIYRPIKPTSLENFLEKLG